MPETNVVAPDGYGVYFINPGDENWTLVEFMQTENLAIKLMTGFKNMMAEKFRKPPFCVAISEGHKENYIPRNELRAVI